MIDYRFTPEAEDDLFEIWCYIARDSVAAAVFLLGSRRAAARAETVTDLPFYFWTVQRYPNYVLVYRPETQPLEIVRILHGMRDLKRLLPS
jgi:antitoxin ParD1/3/4